MTDQAFQDGFRAGSEQAGKVAAIASQAMESLHRAAIDAFAASVANMSAGAQRQVSESHEEIARLRVHAEGLEARLAELDHPPIPTGEDSDDGPAAE